MRPPAVHMLAAAVALLCAALTLSAVSPAAAQQWPGDAETVAGVHLELVRIDGVVREGGRLRLRVRVVNRSRQDRASLRLVVTVHRRTTSRFEYQQAVDHGRTGAIVHAFTADVDPVPAQASRTLEVSQDAAELGLEPLAGRAGVYPLRVQVLDGEEVAGELVTSLVAAADAVPHRLRVGLLLTVAAPPARDARGALVDDALESALRPGGSIAAVTAALDDHPELPLTLAADAHTLEDLVALAQAPGPRATDAAAALASLRAAAARPHVDLLALPYASADLVALVRHGLAPEAARHLTDGARALEAVSGARPRDEVLVPPDGVTAEALAQALAAGVRAVVLPSEYVDLPAIVGPTPSALRRLRAGAGTSLPALVGDPWLEAALADPPGGAARAAQRVLGELATIYHERPGVADRAVLVALPPPRPAAPGLGGALASALVSLPLVEPAGVSELRRRAFEEPELVRLDYPAAARSRELPATHVAALAEARRALGSLDGVLVDDRAVLGRFDRLLLQAASVHYRGRSARARAEELLATVGGTVQRLYRSVEVPETPAVTLTSREGELPVTLRSNADVTLRLRVQLRTARLEVSGGPVRDVVLAPHSTHVLMLPVRALAPGGTTPVEVRVTDADGEVVLATGRVVVRSTAVSVTAVVVVGGTVLFLLVWLLQEAARRRQRAPTGPGRRPARPARGRSVRVEGPRAPAARGRGRRAGLDGYSGRDDA